MTIKLLQRNDIKLSFLNVDLSPYEQGHKDFIPGLSIIDYICHCGPSNMDQKIMSSNKDTLVIIGNGKIAKTLFHYITQRFEVVGFAVEDSFHSWTELIEGGVVDCNVEEAQKSSFLVVNF
jgi:hypothetical protein